MFNRSNIRGGTTCYSFDGRKVGTIGDVGATHFRCDTGFLGFGKDLYIPFTAIDRVEGNSLYLNVLKDRIDDLRWDRQPVGWTG